MKKFLVVFSAFVLLVGLFGTAGAALIVNNTTASSGQEFVSPYFATTEDFNGAALGAVPTAGLVWTWTGNGQIVNGDLSGQYAAPYGVSSSDATNYVSVPTTIPGSASADLGGSYNYLGLWWGSIDDYNKIEFFAGGFSVGSVLGSALPPATGDQDDFATNHYVNIFSDVFFDSFTMTSSQFAFEADNFSVAVTPEPGTMMLLGSGLVGLAGWGRKKFRK